MGDFANRVFAVVRRIPAGKVATYGQVGRMIGAPRAARYVGYALHGNPEPGSEPGCIPCHRVVFKDGRMATGFAFGGPDEQRKMLAAEGVAFDEEGRVLMDAFQWDGHPEGATAGGDGAAGGPLGPPPDFDWEAELAEHPLHRCETCERPRADCRKNGA
ncbi:MGMT family protein [Adlercreutzia caecimuris]|uniref:MGMT family protein n=1 Tax=Adlercreutzia caecimuris TaxID=671266 RepID=UPI0013731B67|nr:MGMT family protein [Adlercreutzia caecimuris]NBJ67179.1 MGMT family protein [Adlercreutzia caecimuris]